MTNLDYLKDTTNTELLFYARPDLVSSCKTFEEFSDLAMSGILNKDKLFSGTEEDIACRFIFKFTTDIENINVYITPLFNHEVISDTYYDYKNYDSPLDSLIAKVVSFFDEEKDFERHFGEIER